MSDFQKVTLLTAIPPNPVNRDGPSGLPWEIVAELRGAGLDVSVECLPLSSNWLVRRLQQLALPTGIARVINDQADVYIAYPIHVSRMVPKVLRERTLIVGPDAPSMLYRRFARIAVGWQRLPSLLLSCWFSGLEKWVASSFGGLAVVGKNDARWIRQHIGFAERSRIHFIPHPVLRSLTPNYQSNDAVATPRLVLSGDLSAKYVGTFFENLDYLELKSTLGRFNAEVLVVGKNNRYIYDRLIGRIPVRYLEWVDDYSEVCLPFRDIHAFPLLAGAGTKNRALTAIAMRLVILSTPIGIENIDPSMLKSAEIFRFRSAMDFNSALNKGLLLLQSRREIDHNLTLPDLVTISKKFRIGLLDVLKSAATRDAFIKKD